MSVTFFAEAGRLAEDGSIVRLKGPHARFYMNAHDLLGILQAIAERRRMVMPEADETVATYACNPHPDPAVANAWARAHSWSHRKW